MSETILCEDYREDLPAYLRGELTGERAEEIRQHLAGCPVCREAAVGAEGVLTLVQHCLPFVQAPEGFAARLRLRLSAEEAAAPISARTAQNKSHSSDRSCRRSVPYGSLRGRLLGSMRRSPYFVASLALHAAAVAIFVILLLRMEQEPAAPIITNVSETAPEQFEFRELANVWAIRRDCPAVTVVAERLPEGLLVDCPQFLSDEALDLVDAPELGCVKGYRAAVGAVGKRVQVVDARVSIPAELADKRLPGKKLTVRVLDFEDRVEFWAGPRWESFAREFASGVLFAPSLPVLSAVSIPAGQPFSGSSRIFVTFLAQAATTSSEGAVRRQSARAALWL